MPTKIILDCDPGHDDAVAMLLAWGSPEIERQTLTVHEAIETLVYDFLRQVHSGWEINDGAYGEFTFDVAERTIKLDYNERYTSSENFSHEF